MQGADVEDEMLSRAPKSQKTQQKTRVGNMDALDPTGQGIKESYERKLQLIDKCYGDKPVHEIFSAILGAQADDPVLEATSDAEDEEGEVPAALALQPLPCVARSCVCACVCACACAPDGLLPASLPARPPCLLNKCQRG